MCRLPWRKSVLHTVNCDYCYSSHSTYMNRFVEHLIFLLYNEFSILLDAGDAVLLHCDVAHTQNVWTPYSFWWPAVGTETCHQAACVSLWIFIISKLSLHKAVVQYKKKTHTGKISLPKITNSKRKIQGQNALLTASIIKTLPQSDPQAILNMYPFQLKFSKLTHNLCVFNYKLRAHAILWL